MSRREWLFGAAAGAVVTAALATSVSAWGHGFGGPVNTLFVLVTVLLGAGFAAVGALLMAARRVPPLGPLLFASGTALVLEMFLRELVYDGVRGGSDPSSWEQVLAWASGWLDVFGLPLPLVVVLLLFPDGHLPSMRWRPVVIAALAVGGVRLALLLLASGPVRLASHDVVVPWGGAVQVSRPTYQRLDMATGALIVCLLFVAGLALLHRFWSGDAGIRQRLKPLALAVSLIVVGLVLQSVPGLQSAGVAVFVAGGAAIPLALAVGALRYRVWDLDPLLVNAIVYAGLALLVTAMFVVLVQGLAPVLGSRLGGAGVLPSVAAIVVAALMFGPARARLEAVSAELAASRQRLAVAQIQERRKLQRNLHDGAQQRLVAAVMQLGAIRPLISVNPGRALAGLAAADTTLRESLDEIRELARGLHPPMLDARGLLDALRTRAELAPQPVTVDATGLDDIPLDPEIETAAYFSVLEGLQNAAKHAPGARVTVRLDLTSKELRWSILDDGPGFADPLQNNGSGLVGMRDRLKSLGGSVAIASSAEGTRISARLPRSLAATP